MCFQHNYPTQTENEKKKKNELAWFRRDKNGLRFNFGNCSKRSY